MTPAARRFRRDGRIAGALYLIVVISGLFCLAYVPSRIGSLSDPAALVSAIEARPDLFRGGISAFLAMQVAFLLLPFALYRVLNDIDRTAATVMVALAVVSVPIGLSALGHRLDALAVIEQSAGYAREDMLSAAVRSLRSYASGLRIATLFWGLWLLPFGYLILRSARLPRVLGALLMMGGMGYVIQTFASLAPSLDSVAALRYVHMPAAFGEIGTCLWLLAFGAKAGNRADPTIAR